MDDKNKDGVKPQIMVNGNTNSMGNGVPDFGNGSQQTKLMIATAALFGIAMIGATFISIWAPENATALTVIGGMVVTAAGFLLTHFKQQVVEEKLKENTMITLEAKSEAKTEAKSAALEAAHVATTNANVALQTVADQIRNTDEAVSELKTAINGRMEELVREAKAAAYQEGFAAGKLMQKVIEDQLHRHNQQNQEQINSLKQLIEELAKTQSENQPVQVSEKTMGDNTAQ